MQRSKSVQYPCGVCQKECGGKDSLLSNWHPARIEIQGIVYSSVEQYYMYETALCAKDTKRAADRLKTEDTKIMMWCFCKKHTVQYKMNVSGETSSRVKSIILLQTETYFLMLTKFPVNKNIF